MKIHDIFILQGGNKGNRIKYLENSLYLMSKKIGKIIQKSSFFKSEAWGMSENSPIFYNRVIKLKTKLSPSLLLKKILDIEFCIGRKKSEKKHNKDRIIDIDILFYDELVLYSSQLIIPHKLLHFRKFALEPMCEISPEKIHPIFNISILELLGLCPDKSMVKKLN